MLNALHGMIDQYTQDREVPTTQRVVNQVLCKKRTNKEFILSEQVGEYDMNMIEDGIIEPIIESEWISSMVVQDKKIRGIRICVDLKKLNDAYLHDPFLTPFTDEVLENVGGQEAYWFTDGFSGYHQINIAIESRHNMIFLTKWGRF
jgi:hypothetical protein